MFKAEWSWFRNNKFYYLVMAALILIPTIYAIVFLSSLWDPYGETQNLPVAVVNQDKKADYQGKELTLGNDLANNLKKSDAMKFTVLSSQKAKSGLDDGKYYMVITIPKDFSKNATTLLDKQPKQMKLDYKTSSGQSFVAGKMTESAAKTIVNNVSSEVTKTYAKTLVGSIKQLGKGSKEASAANGKLADGTKAAQDGANTIGTNLQTLADGSLTLQNGTQSLKTGLSTYLNGVASANQGSQQLTSGITTYTNGVQTAAAASQQLKAGLNQLNGQLNSADTQNQLASVKGTVGKIMQDYNTLQPLLSAANPETLQLVQTLPTFMQQLQTALKGDAAIRKSAVNDAINNTANLTADQKQAVIGNVDGALDQADSKSNTGAALSSLANSKAFQDTMASLQKLSSQQTALLNAASDLQKQMTALQGVNLNDKLAQVASLSSGVAQLSAGADQLASGLNTLSDNSTALQSGSQSLSNGLSQLTNQNQTVLSGVDQLNSGASAITSGSQQLASGSNELASKLGQAVTGNQTLADALGKAGKQTDAVKAKSSVFNQIASPVTSRGTEKDRVPNNGTGMTPYMFSVGLYVGMLAFNVMIDMVTPRRRPRNFLSWFGAKLSVLTFYGFVAASLVYVLSISVLGLNPVNRLGTYGMLLLTAFTFGAITTTLSLWFKKPGAFLGVVFLVLQLSGSAGTYPIQTSSKFFMWLNPYLPMTYTVRAFRETIMIGGSAWTDAKILLVIMVVFLIIMGAYYAANMHTYTMMKSADSNVE